MSNGTDVGITPHARADEPSPNISGDPGRCACGQPADGFDARRGEPTCARCAELRADGTGEECNHQFYCPVCSDEHTEQKPPAVRAVANFSGQPRPTYVLTTDGEIYDVDYAEVRDNYLRCVNFATDACEEAIEVVDFPHQQIRAVQRYRGGTDGGDDDER